MIRLGLLLLFLCSFASAANAATLTLKSDHDLVRSNDLVNVKIHLDTDAESSECVNTLQGIINYDENLIPVAVDNQQSIVPIWIENPRIEYDLRQISFIGGIPHGYCGRAFSDGASNSDVILSVVFKQNGPIKTAAGEATTTAKIYWNPETTVYLNDGFGSQADLMVEDVTLLVEAGVPAEDNKPANFLNDEVPPEAFTANLIKDPTLFLGKYYLIFHTTDKQTGINHYEVKEKPRAWEIWLGLAKETPWQVVDSPYVLTDQSLGSYVHIKAVDGAGNEYVTILSPQKNIYWWLTYLVFPFFLLLLWFWWRRYYLRKLDKKMNKLTTPTTTDDKMVRNEK